MFATLEDRVVRYAALQPCYNAFVDSRTPGSERKENFTIIGPGVAENPAQHVHIAVPHGFNIGGARQPPACVNSQHSHDTAEVFVVHSGHWRFDLGETASDATVECGPGDVISLPTRTFRGFTNIGDDSGFLWAVLGGDNPGRVTWAPQVFDLAHDHGLVLLDDGRLIDTAAGETVPAGAARMPRTTVAQVAALQRFNDTQAAELVSRDHAGDGEVPVIGCGGPLAVPAGFSLHRLDLAAGDHTGHRPAAPEVLFVHRGSAAATTGGERVELAEGDTITLPVDAGYRLEATAPLVAFIVRGSSATA